jgi:hypothetical protein
MNEFWPPPVTPSDEEPIAAGERLIGSQDAETNSAK